MIVSLLAIYQRIDSEESNQIQINKSNYSTCHSIPV